MAELNRRAVLTEFDGVRLGDARLDRRLHRVLAQLSVAPGDSFPEQMKSEADQEALYRFLNNGNVTMDALLGGHRKQTLTRMPSSGIVRILHDTTEFKFEGEREGLGGLKDNKKGFLAHVALAVVADERRTPLGVLGVHPFVYQYNQAHLTRAQKVQRTFKAPRGDKKSSRWERLAFEVSATLPDGVEALHIMDQEGDDYSLFSALAEKGLRFVIRAEAGRRAADKVPLATVLAQEPSRIFRKVWISERTEKQAKGKRPARAARFAELHVRAGTVVLNRTPTATEASLSQLSLQAVHVFEPSPPTGEDPIEWMILTSEPTCTFQQIESIVDHYRARWVIEEYFKALKTGCAFEKRQLTTLDGLTRALALFVPMAWLLLTLRNVARDQPDRDGLDVFTADQIHLLRVLLESRQRRLVESPTVRDLMLGIAALGGHIKNNGNPGWLVLGRGFRRFTEAEEVWNLSTKRSDQS
jgi:transposase-like protein/DDE family transposase